MVITTRLPNLLTMHGMSISTLTFNHAMKSDTGDYVVRAYNGHPADGAFSTITYFTEGGHQQLQTCVSVVSCGQGVWEDCSQAALFVPSVKFLGVTVDKDELE